VDETEIIIEKPRPGRPPKEIKWDQVLLKIQAGCSTRKIAFDLAISPSTLYSKFKDHFGICVSEYLHNAIQDRNQSIEYTQYIKALEGNIHMLKWLGEVWIGQKAPEEGNTKYTTIIVKTHDDARSGLSVHPETLPSSGDQSPESGD
jgi:AraC-like DNA-binding protein